jgi:hypothetical protein
MNFKITEIFYGNRNIFYTFLILTVSGFSKAQLWILAIEKLNYQEE